MSGASKTNSPLVLYAEGVDPEADLVLVCGDIKFFVRRAVCEKAFPVVADSPDKSNGAEFVILGHSAETVEKLLLLVDPDGVIALTPKLIRNVAALAHFLGADALIQSFYEFLVANHELKNGVAAAAFAVDKLLAKDPKWPHHVLTAMVREIIPRNPISDMSDLSHGEAQAYGRMRLREKKIKEAMLQLKGLHESTTMALFQHLAMMSCENHVQAMDRAFTKLGDW